MSSINSRRRRRKQKCGPIVVATGNDTAADTNSLFVLVLRKKTLTLLCMLFSLSLVLVTNSMVAVLIVAAEETTLNSNGNFSSIGSNICRDALNISSDHPAMYSLDNQSIATSISNDGDALSSSLMCGDSVLDTGVGVWFRVDGTGNTLKAHTCDIPVFDTQISVFTGTCNELICVSGNDDFCGVQSSVSWQSQSDAAYYILVHAFGEIDTTSSSTNFSFVVEEHSSSNDDCPGAIPVTLLQQPQQNPELIQRDGHTFRTISSQKLSGSTEFATDDAVRNGESCGSASASTSPGVWYIVIGTGNHIEVTTCGQDTTFDSQLSIFEGTCPDALVADGLLCVDGNDDFSYCGTQSFVMFESQKDVLYYILVHGFGPNYYGRFQITLREVVYTYDSCFGAQPLQLDEISSGSTIDAQLDNLLRTPISSAETAVDAPLIDVENSLNVTDGRNATSTTNNGNNTNIIDENNVNQTFAPMTFAATSSFSPSTSPSALPSSSPSASPSDSATSATCRSTAPGVWYTITGTGTALEATTCPYANYDTVISVFRGNCSESFDLRCIGTNDDSDSCDEGIRTSGSGSLSTQSSIMWQSALDEQYYILVHGYSNSIGDFNILVREKQHPTINIQSNELPPPPGNDNCTASLFLSIGTSHRGSTIFATMERQYAVSNFSSLNINTPNALANVDAGTSSTVSPPVCVGTNPNSAAGIWFKVFGTGNRLQASTCHDSYTTFDTQISVFVGVEDNNTNAHRKFNCGTDSAPISLRCVGGNDDISFYDDNYLQYMLSSSSSSFCDLSSSLSSLSSIVSWDTQLFTQYYILVHGYGRKTGNFNIIVSTAPGPINAQCTGAMRVYPDSIERLYSTTAVSSSLALDGSTALASNCGTATSVQHPGLWFTILGTGSLLRVSTCSEKTTFDTQISLFISNMTSTNSSTDHGVISNDCASLICVGGNNNWCGEQSSIIWQSEKDTLYYFLVHGYNNTELKNIKSGDENPVTGNFSLVVQESTKPNHQCRKAVQLTFPQEPTNKETEASPVSEEGLQNSIASITTKERETAVTGSTTGGGVIAIAAIFVERSRNELTSGHFSSSSDVNATNFYREATNVDADDYEGYFTYTNARSNISSNITQSDVEFAFSSSNNYDIEKMFANYSTNQWNGTFNNNASVIELNMNNDISRNETSAYLSGDSYEANEKKRNFSNPYQYAPIENSDAERTIRKKGPQILTTGPGIWYSIIGSGKRFVATTCSNYDTVGSTSDATLSDSSLLDTQITVFKGNCNGGVDVNYFYYYNFDDDKNYSYSNVGDDDLRIGKSLLRSGGSGRRTSNIDNGSRGSGNLIALGWSDDSPSCGTESAVTWGSEVDSLYYIFVHGHQYSTGDFTLSVSEVSDSVAIAATGAENIGNNKGGDDSSSACSWSTQVHLQPASDGQQLRQDQQREQWRNDYYWILNRVQFYGTLISVSKYAGDNSNSGWGLSMSGIYESLRNTTDGVDNDDNGLDLSMSSILESLSNLTDNPNDKSNSSAFMSSSNDSAINSGNVSNFQSNGGPVDKLLDAVETVSAFAACGNNNKVGVWYKVIGTGNYMMAHTCGASFFDTEISIFTGECGDNYQIGNGLVCVGNNDNWCGPHSVVKWSTQVNQLYYILISHGGADSEGRSDGTGRGDVFSLSVLEIELQSQEREVQRLVMDELMGEMFSPKNDICGAYSAIKLSLNETYVGSTRSSTRKSAMNCGKATDSGASPGIWFSVTGTGQILQASTCTDNAFAVSTFDTQISVFMSMEEAESVSQAGARTEAYLGKGYYKNEKKDYLENDRSYGSKKNNFVNGRNDCVNLLCVDGNDDACGYQSTVRWESQIDTKYYIYVYGGGEQKDSKRQEGEDERQTEGTFSLRVEQLVSRSYKFDHHEEQQSFNEEFASGTFLNNSSSWSNNTTIDSEFSDRSNSSISSSESMAEVENPETNDSISSGTSSTKSFCFVMNGVASTFVAGITLLPLLL